MNNKTNGRILFLDIETSPIVVYTWDIFNQFIGVNQVKKDWNILAWAAKWQGEDEVMYMDQRNAKDYKNDKNILKKLRDLIDSADIIVTQNGVRFDEKKLNARFIINKIQRPSSYRHVDTARIAKKKFGFTSYSLAYLTTVLNTKHKKTSHKKFPGNELWVQCLQGNKEAWEEMEKYNKNDVLALQDVYDVLKSWDDSHPNMDVYHDGIKNICKCGASSFKKNGFAYTNSGCFQRYCCKECHSEFRDKTNLLSKEKKKSLRR